MEAHQEDASADALVGAPPTLRAGDLREAKSGARTQFKAWNWICSDDVSFDASYDAEARTIDTDILGPFEVFVSDEMFNLDQPFAIRVDGEEVWSGSVERRLGFVVAHTQESGGRGRVFAARISIGG